MKLVENLKGYSNRQIVAVFTGNGRTERHLLAPLAQKYNGSEKILFLPSPPLFRPDCGLSALKATKIFASKYGVTQILFLVDKEYFSQKKVTEQINQTLRSFGIGVQNVESPEKLAEAALFISGLVGSRQITINAAVLGEKRCLEEDIAKLVELQLGTKVEPKKNKIRALLQKHGLNIYTLVEKAPKKNLSKAFPALTFILKELERIKWI